MFHIDYDKTLSLILEGDKFNRDKIKDFLESIPKEIQIQIKDAIDKWCYYEDNGVVLTKRNEFCFFGEYTMEDNYRYWFELDMLLNSLTIKKSMYLKDSYEDLLELSLCAPSTYMRVENNGYQHLGHFMYGYGIKETINYDLVDTFLGLMVTIRSKNNFSRFKIVNMDNLDNKKGRKRSRKINNRK